MRLLGSLLLWRLLWLLLWTGSVLAAGATAPLLSTEYPGEGGALHLNGIGTVRQLNLDIFQVAFYSDLRSSDPELQLTPQRRRVLVLRVTADRLFAGSAGRHFRELAHLNNSRETLRPEAEALTAFYALFRHGLSFGDELLIDGSRPGLCVVQINGQEQQRISSSEFFSVLLRGYLGPRPPSLQLRQDLLTVDPTEVDARLARMNALHISEERALLYQEPPSREPPAHAQPTHAQVAPPAEIAVQPVSLAPTPAPAAPPASVQRTPSATSSGTAPGKPVSSPRSSAPAPAAAPSEPAPSAAKAAPALEAWQIAERLADYQLQLQQRLSAALSYPRRELKQKYGMTELARPKGTVLLSLILDRSGEVNTVTFVSKSTSPILDAAALGSVEQQAPFPPLPAQLPETAYEFYVELSFDPNR